MSLTTAAPTDGIDPEYLAHLAQLDAEDDAREARLARPEALATAALWYARNGIDCFPLRPGEKRPATKHGLHDATTDPQQIRAWWAATPQANIGIRTGIRFDVIDIDGPHGYLSLADLRDQNAVPPILGKVHTARGGAHLYVPATGRGNKAGLLAGIDYRGENGYVVAPPSASAVTGTRWTWLEPLNLIALPAVAA